MATRTTKQALSVLALGGATAAIVFGSWAAWTATTTNPGNTVSTATLAISTDKPTAGAIFGGTPLAKPGDGDSQTVTVTNDSDIPMDLSLTQNVSGDTIAALGLKIHDGANCVYPVTTATCTAFGAWDGGAALDALSQGTLAANGSAGDSKTYTIDWELDAGSLDADQGKSAVFELAWTGTPAP